MRNIGVVFAPLLVWLLATQCASSAAIRWDAVESWEELDSVMEQVGAVEEFMESLLASHRPVIEFPTFEEITAAAEELKRMDPMMSPADACTTLWNQFGKDREMLYQLEARLGKMRSIFYANGPAHVDFSVGTDSAGLWELVGNMRTTLQQAQEAVVRGSRGLLKSIRRIGGIFDAQSTVFHELFSRVRVLQSGSTGGRVPFRSAVRGRQEDSISGLISSIQLLPAMLGAPLSEPKELASELGKIVNSMRLTLKELLNAPQQDPGRELEQNRLRGDALGNASEAFFNRVPRPLGPQDTIVKLEAAVGDLLKGGFCTDALTRFAPSEEAVKDYGLLLARIELYAERAYLNKLKDSGHTEHIPTRDMVEVSRLSSFERQRKFLLESLSFADQVSQDALRIWDEEYVNALHDLEGVLMEASIIYPQIPHPILREPVVDEADGDEVEFSHGRLVEELHQLGITFNSLQWKLVVSSAESSEFFGAFERVLRVIKSHPGYNSGLVEEAEDDDSLSDLDSLFVELGFDRGLFNKVEPRFLSVFVKENFGTPEQIWALIDHNGLDKLALVKILFLLSINQGPVQAAVEQALARFEYGLLVQQWLGLWESQIRNPTTEPTKAVTAPVLGLLGKAADRLGATDYLLGQIAEVVAQNGADLFMEFVSELSRFWGVTEVVGQALSGRQQQLPFLEPNLQNLVAIWDRELVVPVGGGPRRLLAAIEAAEVYWRTYMLLYPNLKEFTDMNQFCARISVLKRILDFLRFRPSGPNMNKHYDWFWGTRVLPIFYEHCPGLLSLLERVDALSNEEHTRLHVVTVTRESVLEDTLSEFQTHTPAEIRDAQYKIMFQGEAGDDHGGLSREWFTIVTCEILNPARGLFEETEINSGKYKPKWTSDDQPMMYFAGQFIAKAILEKQPVPAMFTKSFYKAILYGWEGMPVDCSDYEDESESGYRNLQYLGDEAHHVEQAILDDLSYTTGMTDASGDYVAVELQRAGSLKRVTNTNRAHYVRKVIGYKMKRSIFPQMQLFLEGFHSIIPELAIHSKFTWEELRWIISGDPEIDVNYLRSNSVYESGYTAASPQIVWMWEVVGNMTNDHKKFLLQFMTGSPQIPVGGYREPTYAFKIAMSGIQPSTSPIANHLPTTHTCHRMMLLPAYTTKAELEAKLLLAVESNRQGFASI